MTEEIQKIIDKNKELEAQNKKLLKNIEEKAIVKPEIESIVPEIPQIEDKKNNAILTDNKKIKFDASPMNNEDMELERKLLIKKAIEKKPELVNTKYIGSIQDTLREIRELNILTEKERYFIQSLIVDGVRVKKLFKELYPQIKYDLS